MGYHIQFDDSKRGIDYSMGTANFDKETGIHYGAISQDSVMGEVLSEMEFDYGDPTCPECMSTVVDFDDDTHENYKQFSRGCWDYACENCALIFDGEDVYPEDPLGMYIEDKDYTVVSCLDNDLMVINSPYYTYAQYCSPCVPGAGNIDNPLHKDDGIKTYCLGKDFFDEYSPLPYVVYRVSDNAVVALPW